MTKNILLPGGIGYIGSHVILELLLHTEFSLTVIDNYFNSCAENLNRIFEAAKIDSTEDDVIEKFKERVTFYEGIPSLS